MLEIYQALKLSYDDPRESIKRNSWRNFAEKLENKTGKATGDAPYTKEDFELLFDDGVSPILYEMAFLDLVRVFEHIVFNLLDNASGKIGVDREGIQEVYPFRFCAAKFVKSSTRRDINNLGHVQEILEGHLSFDLYNRLDNIVKYRNWLAHGNRFKYESEKERPATCEIEQVAEYLTKY